MSPDVSYAQRFEDLYLMRCFGDRGDGLLHRHRLRPSGLRQHVVRVLSARAGAASRSSRIRGWRGSTRAVRPRDRHLEALVGAAAGEATFYLVERLPRPLDHDREPCARRADAIRQGARRRCAVPVTTLRALCEQHAPASFDFLKVDVEGAEQDVLLGGDWQSYPAEGGGGRGARALHAGAGLGRLGSRFCAEHGYRYVLVRQPQPLLRRGGGRRACAPASQTAPASFDDAFQFRNVEARARRRRRIPTIGWRALLAPAPP